MKCLGDNKSVAVLRSIWTIKCSFSLHYEYKIKHMNENQENDYDEQRGRFQRRTNKFSQLVWVPGKV